MGDALLGIRLGRGRWLRRQLKPHCFPTLAQAGQNLRDLSVRKFERIAVRAEGPSDQGPQRRPNGQVCNTLWPPRAWLLTLRLAVAETCAHDLAVEHNCAIRCEHEIEQSRRGFQRFDCGAATRDV